MCTPIDVVSAVDVIMRGIGVEIVGGRARFYLAGGGVGMGKHITSL